MKIALFKAKINVFDFFNVAAPNCGMLQSEEFKKKKNIGT